MRLAALGARRDDPDDDDVGRALLAHLCRCTGWQTIVEAARRVHDGGHAGARPRPAPVGPSGATSAPAARRAGLEGGAPQAVGPHGGVRRRGLRRGHRAGRRPGGGARRARRLGGGRVARRRPGRAGEGPGTQLDRGAAPSPRGPARRLGPHLADHVRRARPTSSPTPRGARRAASRPRPLANGGAFGGKRGSPVAGVARRLADEHGRPVRVVLSREDVVRHGPKRPPIAAGVRADGSGVLRVARTPGASALDRWVRRCASVARGSSSRRWTCPGRRCRPTCGLRGGPRPPSSSAALDAVRAAKRAGATPSRCGRRRGRAATATVGADGAVLGVGGGRRGPRRGRAAVLRRSVRSTRRSAGCGAKGWPSTRPGRCSTSPSGPSGSSRRGPCPQCEVVVEDDRRPAAGGRAIPSSRRWPPRRGWRPGCPVGVARGSREVAREHAGRALLTGGAGRAVARCARDSSAPSRAPTGPSSSRGVRGPGAQALANLAALLAGSRARAGPTW